jgi:multidrug efflux pump subunit AcrB
VGLSGLQSTTEAGAGPKGSTGFSRNAPNPAILPVIVMLAIPLTVLGVMPGFWLLNVFSAQAVYGYSDPVFFTATAAMLSAIPITFDPIFSGLGWSRIFGLVASTLFTLSVILTTYWLLKAGRTAVADQK